MLARVVLLTTTADLDHVQRLLYDRSRLSYRVVMLAYRFVRRLRGRSSVADGAALMIAL